MRSAKLLDGGQGFDVPPFEKLNDFAGLGRGRAAQGHALQFPAARRGHRVGRRLSGAGASIGVQIYSQGTMCKMIAQCTQQGKSIDEAIAFGESELEGYMRT